MIYAIVFAVTGAMTIIALRGRSVFFIVWVTFPPLILIRLMFWWMSDGEPVAIRVAHPLAYVIMLAVHAVVAGFMVRRFVDAWRNGDFEDFFRK